jgi:hypothetical protein
VSTDLAAVARPSRAPSASACEPYRELIAEALGRGRNATAIWQDLVDGHGFQARYASVRRFVVALRGTTPTEARVVITTAPGEEAELSPRTICTLSRELSSRQRDDAIGLEELSGVRERSMIIAMPTTPD